MEYLGLAVKAIFLTCCFITPSSWAVDRYNRLGLGVSNELNIDVPAVSLKFQKSNSFALGVLVGFNSSKQQGKVGSGIKLYRNILREPQLYFYSSLLGAFVSEKFQKKDEDTIDSRSGLQVNLTLGTEFSFAGLDSIGFSMETGISFNKFDTLVTKTAGRRSAFLISAMHFYL